MVLPKYRYWKRLDSDVVQNAIDLSKNGITASEGFTMLKAYLEANPEQLDIVVIELGANDYLQGRNLDAMKDVLREIVEFVRSKGAVPVLVGFNPRYGNLSFDLYQELSVELSVIAVPDFLKDVWGVRELLLPDGLHPNYMGHEIMAKNVKPYLEQAVSEWKK